MTDGVLVIDYPSPEVPHAFARAGYDTFAHEGPEPDQYYGYTVAVAGDVEREFHGRAPQRVGVVYTYRPVDELVGIVAFACELGAHTLWFEASGTNAGGSDRARAIVEAAGLTYTDAPVLDALGGAPA